MRSHNLFVPSSLCSQVLQLGQSSHLACQPGVRCTSAMLRLSIRTRIRSCTGLYSDCTASPPVITTPLGGVRTQHPPQFGRWHLAFSVLQMVPAAALSKPRMRGQHPIHPGLHPSVSAHLESGPLCRVSPRL